MAKTVRRMLLDAATAIDRYSLKSKDVDGVDVSRYMTNPKIRCSPFAFEKVFRATGTSIHRVKRDASDNYYWFDFSHDGITWHTSVKRSEVESMDSLLARQQLGLPEPSIRINAKSQLLLGHSS